MRTEDRELTCRRASATRVARGIAAHHSAKLRTGAAAATAAAQSISIAN